MLKIPPQGQRKYNIDVTQVEYDTYIADINKSKSGYCYIYIPGQPGDVSIKRKIQFHTNGITLWCRGCLQGTWHAVLPPGGVGSTAPVWEHSPKPKWL